jgi:hypothetical protein
LKTTELFVEQVIIGGLVLLASASLVSPHLISEVLEINLGGALAIVGIIYLIGIVYDRFADTLLQDLEGHNRIWFGLNGKVNKPPSEDPFQKIPSQRTSTAFRS